MNFQELVTLLINHARGMWRYRWQVVIVAWLIALPGWAFVYKMPDIYEATAKVSVDSNSLLPDLTRGLTVTENVYDEVDVISRAMLARPNLSRVATETGLAKRAKTPMEFDELISGLQQQVIVQGSRDSLFSIRYQDYDRQIATDVVSSLLRFFVESSLGAQGDDADMTEMAIKSEIDDHEQRLIAAEAQLADFKTRNLGFMPEDGADYYQRLQAGLKTIEDTEREIRQLRERRDEITRQLQGEVDLLEASSGSARALASCSQTANITKLRAELAGLQVDFTDKHPRIVMLKDTITALEKACDDELAAAGGALATLEATGPDGKPNTVYQNLRLMLSNVDVELAALQEQLRSAQAEVRELRADVDKISTVEKELKKLNRDYDVVEARHQELLRRWETLQSKKRLDPVTDELQFKIIEPPFAPTTPVAPKRLLMNLAVLVLALGAGGAVAFGLNQLRPVFYDRRSLSNFAQLPVLGSVRLIMSPKERAARRRRTLAWAAANVMLLVAAGALIFLADPISEAVRQLTGGGT